MRTTFIILLASILWMLSCTESKEKSFDSSNFIGADSDTSYSTFSKNESDFFIDNQFYKSHQYEDDKRNAINLVLKINEKEIFTNEHSKKQFIIQPISSNESINNWKIETEADNYIFTKNLLSLEFSPKEDHHFDNAYQHYDLKSGKLLLSYTYGVMQINFPDLFSKRYLGFLAKGSNNPEKNNFTSKTTLGYFGYASHENSIKSIELKALNKDIFDAFQKSAPVLEFEIDSSNQNYQKLSERSLYFSDIENPTKQADKINFKVKATFYKGKTYEPFEIIIPIKEDQINTEGIIFDKTQFELNFP